MHFVQNKAINVLQNQQRAPSTWNLQPKSDFDWVTRDSSLTGEQFKRMNITQIQLTAYDLQVPSMACALKRKSVILTLWYLGFNPVTRVYNLVTNYHVISCLPSGHRLLKGCNLILRTGFHGHPTNLTRESISSERKIFWFMRFVFCSRAEAISRCMGDNRAPYACLKSCWFQEFISPTCCHSMNGDQHSPISKKHDFDLCIRARRRLWTTS